MTDIVHILQFSLPLCGFSNDAPKDWPEGNYWIGNPANLPDCNRDLLCASCSAEFRRLQVPERNIQAQALRTTAEIDAAAEAFATVMVGRTEALLGRRFSDLGLLGAIRNAIVVGYHQGVIDERAETLKGGKP